MDLRERTHLGSRKIWMDGIEIIVLRRRTVKDFVILYNQDDLPNFIHKNASVIRSAGNRCIDEGRQAIFRLCTTSSRSKRG